MECMSLWCRAWIRECHQSLHITAARAVFYSQDLYKLHTLLESVLGVL